MNKGTEANALHGAAQGDSHAHHGRRLERLLHKSLRHVDLIPTTTL
jgi:hypothetical protein